MSAEVQPFACKGNQFRAEDLAAYNTFSVPANSPIEEAIDAIKRLNNNAFLHNTAFKLIAVKAFTILRGPRAVEYTTREEWTVTFNNQIILLKDPTKKDVSININQDSKPPESQPEPEPDCVLS